MNKIPVTINQDLKAIKVDRSKFLDEYFQLLLKGIEAVILYECRKAIATVESIEMSYFTNFTLPIPSLKEQEKILVRYQEKNREITKAISKAEREIEAIQEYRESLVANMVTGKINVTPKQLQPI